MAEDRQPQRLSEHSRRYLLELLEQCRRANLPGGQNLIRLIERALEDDEEARKRENGD
jgi:hypothetical protein